MRGGASRAHRPGRTPDTRGLSSSCRANLEPSVLSSAPLCLRPFAPQFRRAPKRGPATPDTKGAGFTAARRGWGCAAGPVRGPAAPRGPQARSSPARVPRASQGRQTRPSRPAPLTPPAKMVPPRTHAVGPTPVLLPPVPSVPRGAAPHNTAPPPARALGEAGAMSAWLRAASPPLSAALKPSSPLHRRARAAPCTWDPSTAAGRETRSCGSEWWGFPDVALPGVPKLKTSPHPTPPAFCRAAQSGLPGFARPRSAMGAAASTTASPPLRSSSDLSRGLTASPAGSAHLRARRGHAGGGGEPWNWRFAPKRRDRGGRGRRRLSRVAARVLADSPRTLRDQAPGGLPCARQPASAKKLVRSPAMSPKGPLRRSPFFFRFAV